MRNFIDKLKRYFRFSKEETISFWIVVVCLAFIYSWTDWGTQRFDAIVGLKNFLIAIALIGITVFVHHAGQRMMSLSLGLRAEHKMWWYGLLIGLILVAITNGKIKFLAATGTLAYLLPIHRLGAFRYGPNLTTLSKIAMAGPVANIFFSAIVKSFEWIGLLSPTIGQKLFVLNLTFAFWNLFPIPPLDGSKIFYYSRLTYVFLFTAFTGYVALEYFFQIYSYWAGLFIGSICWLLYYIFIERKVTIR